jgi:hypothetical protein
MRGWSENGIWEALLANQMKGREEVRGEGKACPGQGDLGQETSSKSIGKGLSCPHTHLILPQHQEERL